MRFLRNFTFCLFLFSNIISSQNNLNQQINVILDSEVMDLKTKIVKVENLFHPYKNLPNSIEKGIVFSKIGNLYVENENNEKAVSSFRNAIKILEKYKKSQLEELNKARISLANLYKEDNKKEYYRIINQIVNDKGKDDIAINAIAILAKRGDYYTGIKRLNALLSQKNSIDKELFIRKTIIKIYAYMHEGDLNAKLNSDLKIIKEHHKKVQENFHKSTLDELFLYGIYNNLANIYDAFGEIDTALELYLKAKNYYQKNGEKIRMLDVTNNLGYLYSRKNNIKQAKICFQQVINESTDEYQLATAYDNMGYFLNSNSSLKKIPYFEKAIQTLLNPNEENYQSPSLDIIRDSGYQQDILIFLIDLSDHYLKAYKETKDKTYLLKAKKSLYLIDELVSLIRYESNTEQSKLFWIEKGVNTYMLATEVCYLLNKPAEAFYFIEKNKALLLQENIKMFQAKLELEIPKKTLELEYKLHYELLTLEKQFQKNLNNATLKQKFSNKNKEFQVLKDLIKRKYPKYSKLKENIDIITIEKAISNLTKDECFITYILNQNDGYGIFCNSQEKIFFKIDNVISFQKKLKTLKEYMTQRLLDKNKTIAFKDIGNSVFKSLFPFPNALNKIKGKKIIIIPDDSLLNLPFEALPINTIKSLSDSYLINYAEVSYLQSFSVFEKIKQKNSKPSKKLLAIAPYQFEDKNLQELIQSKDAIDDLKKYSGVTIFIEEKATKENFYNNCQDYEILHLNTHAGIDSITESPWISFRKSKLTLDELYGINNHSELVILDACKTNDGTIASGEGILSLTRGFFNNGAKSVLASLWNVNEKAGNEIITSFYSELEAGKSKSKAMQIAKMKYLKEHKNTEALPYYWASFTLTGSTEPVELSKSYFQGIPLLIIITSISLLLFFIYKNRKHFISR